MIAPGIEPASSPTDITTSGVRSALTPKIEICETADSWTTTVTRASATSRRVSRSVWFIRPTPAPEPLCCAGG